MLSTLRVIVRPLALGSLVSLLGSCTSSGTAVVPYDALPFAPRVEVIDTVSSLGPLAEDARRITLHDLVAWHGHPCDGLVAAAAGIRLGLLALFPDGIVDRTDLCAAVNRSACYGDVAAFLTGARHRYGSLVIDPQLGDTWILHRRSTGVTVRVSLRPGIKPAELPGLEADLRASGCPEPLMQQVARLQDRFARSLLESPPEQLFAVELLEAFPYSTGELRPDTQKRDCPRPSRSGAR